jgi:hypothetical protein
MVPGAPRIGQTPIPSTFPYSVVPVLTARRTGLIIHWSKVQILAGPPERDRLWRREANGSAPDTSFLFRLCYQITSTRRQCQRAILFAHVAIEQRKNANRYA